MHILAVKLNFHTFASVFYSFVIIKIVFGMTSISVKKNLYKLTMPIFIDIALVMMLGAVDTIMLSRFSDDAVAAVGLDNQLVSLVFLIYQFISMGAAIICAQYFGAGLRTRFIQIVGISLLVNILLGATISAMLWLWAEPLLTGFGLRENLMAEGALYLRITGALSFFQAISLTLSAVLRSTGKTIYPMVATVMVNILNIAGNYALIFGHWGCPAMGVEGAAWATAGSRIASVFLLMCFMPTVWPSVSHSVSQQKKRLAKMKEKVAGKKDALKTYFKPFPRQELKNLFRIGIPAMSEELSYSLSQIVITFFINQISTEALTTKIYCTTIITFVILFSSSIVQGGDIIVGHYVGQLRYRAAYLLGNYVVRTAMLLTMIVATLLALGGRYILEFLTENEEIIRLGAWIFIIDWMLDIGRVKNIFACGTLRAAGDAIYPLIVGVLSQWIIAVGIAWVIGIHLGYGILGMWIAFCMDENLRGVILMRRWHSQRWKGKSFTQRTQ